MPKKYYFLKCATREENSLEIDQNFVLEEHPLIWSLAQTGKYERIRILWFTEIPEDIYLKIFMFYKERLTEKEMVEKMTAPPPRTWYLGLNADGTVEAAVNDIRGIESPQDYAEVVSVVEFQT